MMTDTEKPDSENNPRSEKDQDYKLHELASETGLLCGAVNSVIPSITLNYTIICWNFKWKRRRTISSSKAKYNQVSIKCNTMRAELIHTQMDYVWR